METVFSVGCRISAGNVKKYEHRTEECVKVWCSTCEQEASECVEKKRCNLCKECGHLYASCPKSSRKEREIEQQVKGKESVKRKKEEKEEHVGSNSEGSEEYVKKYLNMRNIFNEGSEVRRYREITGRYIVKHFQVRLEGRHAAVMKSSFVFVCHVKKKKMEKDLEKCY